MHFMKHAQSVIHNTDWYLPKIGIAAMTGGLFTSAVAPRLWLRLLAMRMGGGLTRILCLWF